MLVTANNMKVHLPKGESFSSTKDDTLSEKKTESIDREKILNSFFERNLFNHSRPLIFEDNKMVAAKLSARSFRKAGITRECFENFANEFAKSPTENFKKLNYDEQKCYNLKIKDDGDYIIYTPDSIPCDPSLIANPVVIGENSVGIVTSGLKFDHYIFVLKNLPKKTPEIWTLPEELEF